MGRKKEIPPDELMYIGQLLRSVRNSKKLNLNNVVELCQSSWQAGVGEPVHSRTISRIEKGESGSWVKVKAIANALGCYDELFDHSGLYKQHLSTQGNEKPSINIAAINRNIKPTLEVYKRYLLDAQKRVLANPDIIQLTSLFQNTTRLKMDDAYVELTVTTTQNHRPAPDTLVVHQTEKEKADAREAILTANRVAPRLVLDLPGDNKTLILGDPGSGKSSLMRRIAISIAKGEWTHYKLPLFIKAADYIYRSDENQSLEDFAWDELCRISHPGAVQNLKKLRGIVQSEPDKIILIVDGLDEISSSPKAVREKLYSGLLQTQMSWISTSRPAGLMGRPEKIVYTLASLDRWAIEDLILKWSKVTFGQDGRRIATNLTSEIGKSGALSSMAQNPFLLTALIFLKSRNPESPLPVTKIEVYEALIESIAFEARSNKTPDMLSGPVQISLAKFSFDIFNSHSGIKQVFSDTQWNNFQHKNKTNFALHSHVLGARLITEEHNLNHRYHFIHLSLQEHFVARHMLCEEVKDMLPLRHIPSWRNAFIAYGALLFFNDDIPKFKTIVTTLWEERDQIGQQVILLAQIFASSGIRNTKPWIEKDLREFLLVQHGDFFNPVIDDMGMRALAELDPDWLCSEMEHDIQIDTEVSNPDFIDGEDWYPGSKFAFYGATEMCPYQIISTVKTGYAYQFLRDTFWGNEQTQALQAAPGFAHVSTYKDRQDILKLGLNSVFDSESFLRSFAFFDCLNHPEGIPIFMRCLNGPWWDHQTKREQALQAIWLAGGDDAYSKMLDCTNKALKQSNNTQYLESVLKYAAYLGGKRSKIIFDTVEKHKGSSISILGYKIKAGVVLTDEIDRLLSFPKKTKDTIAALAHAAEEGFTASINIISHLQNIPEHYFDSMLGEFITIEAYRSPSITKTSLCPQIYHACQRRVDDGQIEETSILLEKALSIFSQHSYYEAIPLAEWALVKCFDFPETLAVASELIGLSCINTDDLKYVTQLEDILFRCHEDAYQDILHAIGRISPEHLNNLKGHPYSLEAIGMLATHHDWMLYDDFWTDEKGTRHNYKNKPIEWMHFLIQPSDIKDQEDVPARKVSEYIGQVMSQYHIAHSEYCLWDKKKPLQCKGVILIRPNKNNLVEQKKFDDAIALTLGGEENKLYSKLPRIVFYLDESKVIIRKKIMDFFDEIQVP